MRAILPDKRATQNPPLAQRFPPAKHREEGPRSERGGWSLVVKGQPRDSRREGPGTLQWGAEYGVLSSSGVTGKVAPSISDRRGNGVGAGEGAFDMGFSS